MQIIFIAGQSGSGKTTVMQIFSELRYTILEGISYKDIDDILKILKDESKVCIVISEDNKEEFDKYYDKINSLRSDYDIKTLYLCANDDVLISRYKELRKLHPLQIIDRDLSLTKAIDTELKYLDKYAKDADFYVDTSFSSKVDLLKKISSALEVNNNKLSINILSFGFKYGTIKDADYIFDVRFLPNPYYIKELKKESGLNDDVYDYVFSTQDSNNFYEHLLKMIEISISNFEKLNKLNITIAFACTGGKHRSVSFARRLSSDLGKSHQTYVRHLEQERGNW